MTEHPEEHVPELAFAGELHHVQHCFIVRDRGIEGDVCLIWPEKKDKRSVKKGQQRGEQDKRGLCAASLRTLRDKASSSCMPPDGQ